MRFNIIRPNKEKTNYRVTIMYFSNQSILYFTTVKKSTMAYKYNAIALKIFTNIVFLEEVRAISLSG